MVFNYLFNMKSKKLPEQDVQHFLNNVYTQSEAERVCSNLKDNPDYQNIISKSTDEIWDESEDYMQTPISQKEQYRDEASRLLRKINKTQFIIHPYIRWALSIAASIIIILTLGIGLYHYNHATQRRDILYSEASTSFGNVKKIKLPDGTIVTLNACSHLKFPKQFEGSERNVKLEGEAFFQVARNEKKPFIITTGKFNVKVLGTEFNVKTYSADLTQTVSVKRGKVQVEMPEATIRLIKNEQLELNSLNASFNKRKDNQDVATWRVGCLSFNKTPIKDVANELERRYNCKIVFEREENFDNIITGEHSNKSLESVLSSIEYTSGIHFKMEENGRKIMLYK